MTTRVLKGGCRNMDIYFTIICFILFELSHAVPEAYNRSVLMEMYPEFGKEFVIFPGENAGDKFRVAYLNSSVTVQPRLLGIGEHNFDRDVTFTLFTRNHPEGRQVTDVDQLPSDFDKRKKTKFIVHGWMGKGTSDVCVNIKNGFLNTSDVNVFIVDWSPIADNVFYPIPMRATPDVGNHYAEFLNDLIDKKGVNPKDIHLIGHSLGAHISGFAGRGVRKAKVARITGLDPALPGFNIPLVQGGRLNRNDSDFVDIIHTCAGFLGLKDPIGHVDFYPNGGGPPQPGCTVLELFEACSHSRSWQLFSTSIILDEPLMATECESLSSLGSSKCNGEEIPMGVRTPLNANGIYYVETTGEEPYVQVNDETHDE